MAERERVEVRPGVHLWLSGADLVAFRARETPVRPVPVEVSTIAAPEAAVVTLPRARKPVKR